MLLALVFGSVLFTVLGGISAYVLSENHYQTMSGFRNQAFAMAEAGLEYYRWHLAHYPDDLLNGTGQTGPYLMPYQDPEGGETGTISLEVIGNSACGETTSVTIRSTGIPEKEPTMRRTIEARYAQPTVAGFSYVLNANVWAGSDRVISGPYHSNGGIRMDGTANSQVTSSLASWSCTSNFGCSPTQGSAPGVVGSGPNQSLWTYPVPQVDFAGIAADFSSLKTLAQSEGLYFSRQSYGTQTTNANYWKGYRLIFNANGTVTVRRVTSVTSRTVLPINAADTTTDYAQSGSESLVGTYALPSDCGLIFVEDHAWVEGVIPQKVTLVVANVADNGIAPNAYLKGNITYGASDGSDGLTLIAEHNVLIVPDAPTNMSLSGIFIAQGGAFGRNLYRNGTSCHSTFEPKGTLTILGTTVSNKRTGTKWVNGCGSNQDAGFQTRIDSYDRTLATDPPPFTPIVSNDYQFIDWREK